MRKIAELLPLFRRKDWFFSGLLVALAVLVAYHNSLSGPFIFDDGPAIIENPTLRQLWPISQALSPPHGALTVSGRPLVNLSLAINYALGGTAVHGYHLFNVGIHLLASLTLFGVVRRTLSLPALRERFGDPALPLVITLLWSLHPLQTEAVTYVVQRAESLMGLFYLLTLYCFIRGAESRAAVWHTLAVVACLGGMATKEVMVSAPLMTLLYDRTFVSGSFGKALRRHWRLYLGLAGSWLLLGWLVATGGSLGNGHSGFDSKIGWSSFVLTEFWAVSHYLWLSVWPHQLVLDYGGAYLVTSAAKILPCGLLVVSLLGGTIISLRRWPAIGFAGCWFFGILAVTSSVFPLGDTVFEHRMYLSLAGVMALLVLAIYSWLGRWSLVLFFLMAATLLFFTVQRNADYRSDLAIWGDTVAKRPDNAGAQINLGSALLAQGQMDQALVWYRKALQINPNNPEGHNNLGTALERQGNLTEAITHYREALRLAPNKVEIRNNLGVALARSGKLDEAIQQFRAAIRAAPGNANAYGNLGNALAARGKTAQAVDYYRKALELDPGYADAHNNLGNALSGAGNSDEAIIHYRRAIQINSNYVGAYYNLGTALVRNGRPDAAVDAFLEALRREPNNAGLHNNLGAALALSGKPDEAIHQYAEALRLSPDYADAADNLGNALFGRGRFAEAADTFRKSLELQPGRPEAHFNLARALAQLGQREEAMKQLQEALRLKPDYTPAKEMLKALGTAAE